jgi:hypothetical protein
MLVLYTSSKICAMASIVQCNAHLFPSPEKCTHLERIVLRCNLLVQVGTDGCAREDVLADLGNLCEEEQGEDAGDGTEATKEGAAVEILLAGSQ